jgi:hypothetical protein
MAVSDVGDLVFPATLVSGSQGIYRARGGSLEAIVKTGDPAPGTNAVFTRLAAPTVTSSGLIGFWASLQGPTSAGEGLWTWSNGILRKVVSTGDTPLGMPFDHFVTVGASLPHEFLLNDNGQMAFEALLQDSGGAYTSGVFAYDRAIGVYLLARDNQTLEVAPGDVRKVIPVIDFDLEKIDDTRFNSLNSSGRLGVKMIFPTGQGLFVTTVPEPSTLLLLTIATLAQRRRRR